MAAGSVRSIRLLCRLFSVLWQRSQPMCECCNEGLFLGSIPLTMQVAPMPVPWGISRFFKTIREDLQTERAEPTTELRICIKQPRFVHEWLSLAFRGAIGWLSSGTE